MCRECRERFPRHGFQWKPLVSDPDMHRGTWWRVKRSLAFPAHAQPANLRIWQEAHDEMCRASGWMWHYNAFVISFSHD